MEKARRDGRTDGRMEGRTSLRTTQHPTTAELTNCHSFSQSHSEPTTLLSFFLSIVSFVEKFRAHSLTHPLTHSLTHSLTVRSVHYEYGVAEARGWSAGACFDPAATYLVTSLCHTHLILMSRRRSVRPSVTVTVSHLPPPSRRLVPPPPQSVCLSLCARSFTSFLTAARATYLLTYTVCTYSCCN